MLTHTHSSLPTHTSSHIRPPLTRLGMCCAHVFLTHISASLNAHTLQTYMWLFFTYIHVSFSYVSLHQQRNTECLSLSLSLTQTLSCKHFFPWYIDSAYTHISLSCKSNSSDTFFFLTYTHFHMTTPRHKLILSHTFIFMYICLSHHTYQ